MKRLALAVVAGALGCNALLGLDPPDDLGAGSESASGSSGAGASTSGAGGSASTATNATTSSGGSTTSVSSSAAGGGCSGGKTCYDPPQGWTLVFEADGEKMCPSGTKELVSGGTAIVADSSCGCACDVGCERPTVYELASDCTTEIVEHAGVVFGACGTIDSTRALEILPSQAAGSCAAEPTSVITPASFTQPIETCSLPTSECGANGACLDAIPASFSVCVASSGAATCPPGWPQQTLLYTSIADDRSCSACSCGTPSAGNCDVQLEEFSDATCNAVSGFEPSDACVYNGSQSWMAVVDNAPKCVPNGGTLQGSATPASPYTVCCQ